jgi:adenosylmethionine-8-amino-7-oxononanoate aminotransferase
MVRSRAAAAAQTGRWPSSAPDVRGGNGLLSAIDLVRNNETKEAWGPSIKEFAFRTQELGLITRVWDVLHLAPPLAVTVAESRLDRRALTWSVRQRHSMSGVYHGRNASQGMITGARSQGGVRRRIGRLERR